MGKGTFVGSFRSKIFTTNQNGRTNEEYTTVSAIDGCSDVDFVDDDETHDDDLAVFGDAGALEDETEQVWVLLGELEELLVLGFDVEVPEDIDEVVDDCLRLHQRPGLFFSEQPDAELHDGRFQHSLEDLRRGRKQIENHQGRVLTELLVFKQLLFFVEGYDLFDEACLQESCVDLFGMRQTV